MAVDIGKKGKTMCEKKCKTCRFWESDLEVVNQYDFGFCKSGDVDMDIMNSNVAVRSRFGCIHWQQREPDLREQLATLVNDLLSCSRYTSSREHGYVSLGAADDIIAIFEKWQKGKRK